MRKLECHRVCTVQSCSSPVLVHQEPGLKLLEGTSVLTYFPNANRSLRHHPRILPVGRAELMKPIHLASSCFSKPYLFFRRSSCLYWEQQSCAFIHWQCVTARVQGPEIRPWAALHPNGVCSLFAVNGNQNRDSPTICRGHLGNVKTVIEDPLIWKPGCVSWDVRGVTFARLIGISHCLR